VDVRFWECRRFGLGIAETSWCRSDQAAANSEIFNQKSKVAIERYWPAIFDYKLQNYQTTNP
jgi:hypothetical protein